MRFGLTTLVPAILATALLFPVAKTHASTLMIEVTFENLAPDNGIFFTPVWVGFHDGTFDTYDGGAAASVPLGGVEIERIAEDGNTMPLSETFNSTAGTGVDATLDAIGPIGPGESVSFVFTLDTTDPNNQYFSYASMIIPSNDAFIANGNPLAHQVFDDAGNFLGLDFFVLGSETNDAGTEVNDEIPENTAFFGQTVADTGVDENGIVVTPHPGFLPPGSGGILDDPMFANADFLNFPNDQLARFSATVIPEPSSVVLTGLGLLGLAGLARRLRRA